MKRTHGGLTRAVVNLWALGDLGETIIERLLKAHKAGTLALGVAEDEFKMRFFMEQGTDPPADRTTLFIGQGSGASVSAESRLG